MPSVSRAVDTPNVVFVLDAARSRSTIDVPPPNFMPRNGVTTQPVCAEAGAGASAHDKTANVA